MPPARSLLQATLLLPLLSLPALCADFHVQPDGKPNQLHTVLDQVRTARAAGDLSPAKIFLASGTYEITGPLVLEPKDSDISFQAEPGAAPVISGGKRIGGFTVNAKGVWETKLDPALRFESLWVNGKRATRAQTPNTGYFFAMGVGDTPIEGIPLAGPFAKVLLKAKPSDLATMQGLSEDEKKEVQVIVYHCWDESRLKVAGMRESDGTLQFTGANASFFEFEPFHRLKFENYKGALDLPGEWFLAKDGTLAYIPQPGEKIADAVFTAPVAEQWVVLKGDAEKGEFVQRVRFTGIEFAFQNWVFPEKGIHARQAEVELKNPAVELNGSKDVVFDTCQFTHTTAHAAWVKTGCENVTFTKCLFTDLGAGGVYIGNPDVDKAGPKHTHHVTVEDSVLRGGGRYFPSGIGICFFQTSDSVARHCDISDFYYSGVNVGWIWGFRSTPAGRNTVEYCHIHHLGWTVLSDMGGVYTLGSQIGTVIRNNHIHDLGAFSYGAWGMYNDEGSTGVLWENNLVYNTQSAGYHQHYGRGNLVRNNILAWGKDEQLRWSRPETELGFAYQRNILLVGEGNLLTHEDKNWHTGRMFMDENIYWDPTQKPLNFAGKTFAEWQALGNDTRSLIADPLFVAPEKGDWTLKPESPALKLGFVPFDWKKAGVRPGTPWENVAKAPLPPMIFGQKPTPPPVHISQGFETEGDDRKESSQYRHNLNGLYIVKNIEGHPGKCLEFRDGPDLKHVWEPALDLKPNHVQGVSRMAYDLRLENDFHFVNEWRSNSKVPGQVYASGLRLVMKDGGVSLDGKPIGKYPSTEWIRVEIEFELGENANPPLSIKLSSLEKPGTVILETKTTRTPMDSLGAVVFLGAGTVSAKAWMDNIEVIPKE